MPVETIKIKELLRMYYSYYGKVISFSQMLENDQDPEINVSILPQPTKGRHMITHISYIENS